MSSNSKPDSENKNQNSLVSKVPKKLCYDYENHLNELIKEIISLHKNDGYENFEEISMYIKKRRLMEKKIIFI